MIKIIELATTSSEHYVVRDILGAVSFILTACTMEEYEGMPYYDAVFDVILFILYFIYRFIKKFHHFTTYSVQNHS